jgi:hypothetical protein
VAKAKKKDGEVLGEARVGYGCNVRLTEMREQKPISATVVEDDDACVAEAEDGHHEKGEEAEEEWAARAKEGQEQLGEVERDGGGGRTLALEKKAGARYS